VIAPKSQPFSIVFPVNIAILRLYTILRPICKASYWCFHGFWGYKPYLSMVFLWCFLSHCDRWNATFSRPRARTPREHRHRRVLLFHVQRPRYMEVSMGKSTN
jgi:hypothetical protein